MTDTRQDRLEDAVAWAETYKEERDRLARRVAELEAENADLADFATHRAEHDSRVAELEAALASARKDKTT